MNTLQVKLSGHSYPIYVGAHLAPQLSVRIADLRAQGRRVVVVTDDHVASAQSAWWQFLCSDVHEPLPVYRIPPGESSKCIEQLSLIFDWLAAHSVDRGSVLFAVGGGVVGDLAGFAAACFLRGIDCYQVPTTLLAMVDSSVGGKTGVNIAAGKNLVGAFYQPQAVYVDTNLLSTLPAREFSAGMAEVIKYGMLYDRGLFDRLMQSEHLTAHHPSLPSIIQRCCEIKAEIVQNDEKETLASGGRALLNLGHTFAHGIENVSGYGEYLHGEAVSVGLVLATLLSQKLGWLDDNATEPVMQLLKRYDLPTALRAPLSTRALMAAMSRDKKVSNGKLRFVAMQALGQAVMVDNVTDSWIPELWQQVGAIDDIDAG